MINTIYFTKDKIIIAQGTYSKRIPKIKKEVTIDLPENVVVDGEILDMVKLTHLISTTLKKEKMKTNSVIFGIQNKNISTVNVSFPNVKKQLLQAVSMKLSESYIGISDDNYISYKLNKIENNLCSGFAVIAPKAILNAYYTLSLNIECKLLALDYMGNMMYKLLYMNEKKFRKSTFLIADVANDDVCVYLYNNGVLAMSKSENSTSIYTNEEAPDAHEITFDNRVVITDEDKKDILNLFELFNARLEDLSSFIVAQHVYAKRYLTDANVSTEDKSSLEYTTKNFKEMLEILKINGKKPINFEQIIGNVLLDSTKDLLFKLQKCKVDAKKFVVLNCPFESEIENSIAELVEFIQKAIEIFEKYFVMKTDQKVIDRKRLIKRLCLETLNLAKNADFSGDYPDIQDLYVNGINLSAREKKMVENNINSYYPIEIHNYESYFSEFKTLSISLLYNEAPIGKDLDLGMEVEKNDKINRNNFDNILIGFGGVGCFAVATLIGLSGFYYFMTYQMNENIKANEKYIADNADVYRIVDKRNKLTAKVDEVNSYEEYFKVANVNLSVIERKYSALSKDISIQDLSIDDSFMINMKISAKNLKDISYFVEKIFAEGNTDVKYNSIEIKDAKDTDKYHAMVTFKYVYE
ncbi:MAG: hypothetical protein RR500_00805 [Bacilli bacterium]